MILRPHSLNAFLSEDDIAKYETSNSVIVSHTLFEDIVNNNNYNNNMFLLGLFYNDKKIYVDVDASHYDDSNLIYIPLWIYQYLNYKDEDYVEYMQICPIKGNKVKIKPLSDFYAYLPDPVNSLRDGFEKYSILINNTTIPILVDNRILYIEIIDTYSNNSPICIRGVELEVEIEEIEELVLPNTVPLPNTIPIASSTIPVIPTLNGGFDLSGIVAPTTSNQKKFPGKGYSMK